MAFELPKLKYSYDSLEPHIDSKTISDCPYVELKEVTESENLVNWNATWG